MHGVIEHTWHPVVSNDSIYLQLSENTLYDASTMPAVEVRIPNGDYKNTVESQMVVLIGVEVDIHGWRLYMGANKE